MRFEIRGGGFFVILLGIAALSSAVFMFGLLAGYDVGRQSQLTTEEVATTYSIPSAPLAEAPTAPAMAATPAAIAAEPPSVGATEADNEDTEAPPSSKSH